MEVSGQLHALAALPQERELLYQLDRTLGGPQSPSKRGGEGKIYHHCPCREFHHRCQVHSLVPTPTELLRLERRGDEEINDILALIWQCTASSRLQPLTKNNFL
jgi:hypothetical protein